MAFGPEVINAPHLDPNALNTFAGSLHGEVLRPGHRDYDRARAVHNAMIDRRPALIVRCSDVSDILRALEFAHRHEIVVAVRGGSYTGARFVSAGARRHF